MASPLLIPILGAGFTVAFAHAALPTHWLPFVLAGRAQGWTARKVMLVTALAGGGHVLFTALLGVLVAGFGMVVVHWTGSIFPVLAGAMLMAIGGFYLIRQMRGAGAGHGHSHGMGHAHPHGHDHAVQEARAVSALAPATTGPLDVATLKEPRSDRAVILALILMLTLSPCEGFLPVFLSGIHFGWLGFLALTAVLALATLLGMLLFTWLTLKGLQHVHLEFLESYQDGILGVALVLIGLVVMVLNP